MLIYMQKYKATSTSYGRFAMVTSAAYTARGVADVVALLVLPREGGGGLCCSGTIGAIVCAKNVLPHMAL